MKVILDTHVFLWLQTEPERLGKQLPIIEDRRTELLLSVASSWEIAIKSGLGRLSLPDPVERYVPERLRALGARSLPIEQAHALAVAGLPPLHRDPFDRLLVAQARTLKVPIMTADLEIARYPVETLLTA